MSREIKFRAWERSLKEMIPVWEIAFDKVTMVNHTSAWRTIGVDVDLMQYTGLKDKNGVEIYEGDILAYPETRSSTDPNGVPVRKQTIEVAYSTDYIAGFKPFVDHYDYDGAHFMECVNQYEVIGNIYASSELLN